MVDTPHENGDFGDNGSYRHYETFFLEKPTAQISRLGDPQRSRPWSLQLTQLRLQSF
jgi:hypothetical protein